MTEVEAKTVRTRILNAAFEEVHSCGFQSASLQSILQRADVSKGGFYHHFSSKNELGYALVRELLAEEMQKRWISPLRDAQNPALQLLQHLKEMSKIVAAEKVIKGCPLNNLAQEMSSVDESFRVELNKILESWVDAYTDIFLKAQKRRVIKSELEARSIAAFIVAEVQGTIGLVKSSQSTKSFEMVFPAMQYFLQSLIINNNEV